MAPIPCRRCGGMGEFIDGSLCVDCGGRGRLDVRRPEPPPNIVVRMGAVDEATERIIALEKRMRRRRAGIYTWLSTAWNVWVGAVVVVVVLLWVVALCALLVTWYVGGARG